MRCRYCKKYLDNIFLDLGYSPLSNAYLYKNDLNKPEIYYPLKIYVCKNCWLVQTKDYVNSKIIFNSKYAYFSSTSSTWLSHIKNYSEEIIKELSLNKDSYVIEIASNDGYLLKNFLARGIKCLGIEPTASTATVAKKMGIDVITKFFSKNLAKKLALKKKKADLIIGNNVYAHVRDISDFTVGLKKILKKNGTITLEFPHLMRLIKNSLFDTVYHEHFSYLSLYTVSRIFKSVNLRIFKVKELKTHGGSLRIYGCHSDDLRKNQKSVSLLLQKEKKAGLQKLKTYQSFQSYADKIKNNLLSFLIKKKKNRKKVVAYGAAAKGNTLLNYAGIKTDLLTFVYDAARAKQGCFMPGSHIPILSTKQILNKSKPDYILILPWNIANEVKKQNYRLVKKGIKFIVAVPKIKII